MTRKISDCLKICSPICDAIICNNKLHRLLSRSFFEANTLKLTTLPVKRVARDAGSKPALLGCASRRWLSLFIPWEVYPL